MILVDIMCGMGNQMFQYAFARTVQEMYGEKHIYFSFVTAKRMKDGRKYSLQHFKLNNEVKIPPESLQLLLDIIVKLKKRYFKKKFNNIASPKRLYEKYVEKGIYTTDSIFAYYGIPLTQNHFKYINGWWQSPQYFMSLEEKLRSELQVITPPSKANKKMIQQIMNSESVCVHVRRGDYISERFSSELNICNEKYYTTAMDIIMKKVENPIFYIFSTSHKDIEWIKRNWKFKYPVVYVDLDNPDYEELRLMYSCKHFIVANSTFSWWGAFLSDNPHKIVIAPEEWNRRDSDYQDIYMNNWIRIKCV